MVEVGDMVRFVSDDTVREPRWLAGDVAVVVKVRPSVDGAFKVFEVRLLRTGRVLVCDEGAFAYRIMEKLDDV